MWTSEKRSAQHQEDSFARSVRHPMKRTKEAWALRKVGPEGARSCVRVVPAVRLRWVFDRQKG